MKNRLPLLFLTLLLSGCTTGPEFSGETTWQPRAGHELHPGSAFLYDLEGSPRWPAMEAVYDYPADEQPPGWSQAMPFPAGSELMIVVGDTTEMMAANGSIVEALQATVYAHRPGDPWLRIRDLFQSSAGEIVYASTPVMRNAGEKPELFGTFMEGFLPGPLYQGVIPPERTNGFVGEWNNWLDARPPVDRKAPFDVRVSHDEGLWTYVDIVGNVNGATSNQLIFHRDIPLPVNVEYSAGNTYTTMRMASYLLGSGAKFIEPEGPSPYPPKFPPVAGRYGLAPTGEPSFPTSFAVARDRTEAHLSEWLGDHPNAQLVQLSHQMGSGETSLIDMWRLIFSDGMDAQGVDVKRHEPSLLQPEWVMGNVFPRTSGHPADFSSPVSFEKMQRAHEFWYGARADAVLCDANWGCGIGSHKALNMPPAEQGLVGTILPGLQFDMHSGLALTHYSQDPKGNVVGVPRPNLADFQVAPAPS